MSKRLLEAFAAVVVEESVRVFIPSLLPLAWLIILAWITYEILKSKLIENKISRGHAAIRDKYGKGHKMIIYSLIFMLGGGLLCFYWWGIGKALALAKVSQEHLSAPASVSNNENAPPMNIPSLEPTLVIDSIQSNIFYHFEVLNTGTKPAYQITYAQKATGFTQMEGEETGPKLQRELAPGQTMRITQPTPSAELTSPDFFKTLLLSYSGDRHGSGNHFCKEFHFIGQKELLKVGPLHFESCRDCVDSPKPTPEQIKAALEMSTGTIGLVLSEKNEQAIPSRIIIHAANRSLDYDFLNNSVKFKSLNADGRLISLNQEVKTNAREMHLVILSWNKFGASLKVDDSKIDCDPTNWDTLIEAE